MCIRDRYHSVTSRMPLGCFRNGPGTNPISPNAVPPKVAITPRPAAAAACVVRMMWSRSVSYTHLDVYKRQVCTHGNAHLSDGLIVGGMIECPKHNGRFNLIDGSPARTPICRGLATYPIEECDGRIRINVLRAGGSGARQQRLCRFRVISNRSVATFIKELVLEPLDGVELSLIHI